MRRAFDGVAGEASALVVDVTPEQAKGWLACSGGNRSVRKAAVSSYADDMRRGRWLITGETVKFDVNGRLIDGHHRLRAVVEAGVPVRLEVRCGLSPDAMMAIDTGVARRAGDNLRIARGAFDDRRTAIARVVACLAAGYEVRISVSAYEAFERDNQALLDGVMSMFAKSPCQLSPVMGAIIYAHPVSPLAVMTFAEAVAKGESLRAGDPAHALREALLMKRAGRGLEVARKTLSAIRAALQGRRLTKVYVSDEAIAYFKDARGGAA